MYYLKRLSLCSAFVVSLVLLSSFYVRAQLRLPRASQAASIKQTIGVTDVTITYNRPGVKGRKVWGDPPKDSYAKGEATLDDQNRRPEGMPLVPYGHVWRTGANEATQFTVTDDVYINGQKLPAGTYSLHTIPGKDEWTIVFNSTANQWGSFSYDESKDTLRVNAKPQLVNDNQEYLDFSIEPDADNTATVSIRWEKLNVPFTIEIRDMTALVLTKAKAAVASAKSDDWQTPLNAANFAKSNNAPNDAKAWFGQAISAIDQQIAKKETFQLLSRKSGILRNAGRMPEALEVAEKAVKVGKAEGVDTSALEKQITDAKKAGSE